MILFSNTVGGGRSTVYKRGPHINRKLNICAQDMPDWQVKTAAESKDQKSLKRPSCRIELSGNYMVEKALLDC
jgi:hypothetical protein